MYYCARRCIVAIPLNRVKVSIFRGGFELELEELGRNPLKSGQGFNISARSPEFLYLVAIPLNRVKVSILLKRGWKLLISRNPLKSGQGFNRFPDQSIEKFCGRVAIPLNRVKVSIEANGFKNVGGDNCRNPLKSGQGFNILKSLEK